MPSAAGAGRDVELIVGHNRDEWRTFLLFSGQLGKFTEEQAAEALHLAEAQVAGGGQAHLYELTWQSPGNGGVMRACHGLDGPLLFGTYDAQLGPPAIGPEPTAEAQDLTCQIRTAWTSFATSGTPGAGPRTTPSSA
ncbi:hypothetical protein [Nonomuraea polychroma]|uniref:hypothetical protein n=1 Tax=Nonomuraea polychroma TaxID=46176 RepID=UPI000FDDA2ED|nr:hypothetical protein [Nonomuraea polychroma]